MNFTVDRYSFSTESKLRYFLHKDLVENQPLARKVVRLFGGVSIQDIENECAHLSQLCHPGRECTNVVEVFGHGWLDTDRSWYYIDMELCSETLADRIGGQASDHGNLAPQHGGIVQSALMHGTQETSSVKSPPADPKTSFANKQDKTEGHIDWTSLFKIIEDVSKGLAYIHKKGTVHRDLKPHNSITFYMHALTTVLFSSVHNCWKIGDFGTASSATSKQLHTTRYSRGTAGYRAPELLDSGNPRFNNKADIFALGCIIYEVLTGTKLFLDDFKINSFASTGKLPRPIIWPTADSLGVSGRLDSLERLVSKMLEIEPRNRPSVTEIQNELAAMKRADRANCYFENPGIPIQVRIITPSPRQP